LEAKWTAGKGLIVSFTFNEIQLATKNFAQEIGKGGAGTVFKAEFGKSAIAAVKRLDKLHQAKAEKAFRNEIETIGLIRHVNLVELHGYCATADQRLLVYEYVENSSLDKALFCTPDREHVLEWRCRYKIALQTARAIHYLHEDRGRGTTIIHCDIKPENILLDSTMSAKVADFGLARILNWERSRTLTVQVSCHFFTFLCALFDQSQVYKVGRICG
jgi:serine/threonine protein kinase